MAAEENQEQDTETAESKSGGSGSKLLVMLTGVNLVVTVGIVVVLFISFKKEKSHQAVSDMTTEEAHGESGGHGGGGFLGKKESKFGKIVDFDQFTVNLSGEGSLKPQFVRVNVSMEVMTNDLEEEIKHKLPKVRNTVIDLFNSKKPSDLEGVEGRTYLKDEIKNAVNSFLITGKVKEVFFTNFAVTR